MNRPEIEAAELAARGVSRQEVERQLELYRHPPGYADLVRSCSIGDGIERLAGDQCETAEEACERARAAGRLSKFVPASGAASRMFQALQAASDEGCAVPDLRRRAAAGDEKAAVVVRFIDQVERLPFAAELAAELSRRGGDLGAGDLKEVVAALLDGDGLGYAEVPKGLLPFHRYGDATRTAFEEHLREAADLVRDDAGRVRLHFTVSPEHVAAFASTLGEVRGAIESEHDCRLEVAFSTQSPSTDTIAVDLDDRPLRDDEGRLVFRPGGHGALLSNLADSGADVALLQNIDNVQPEGRRPPSLRWKRLLIGRLVLLEEMRNRAIAGGDPTQMRGVCETLGMVHGEVADRDIAAYLDRPIRVCGVVPNTGEPGGGPFWVRDASGAVTRQIIESAQVDFGSPEQREMFATSTHFNPVLLACGLRDGAGRPYDLQRFVDPRAVFIARKSVGGRDIKALERPGLWNGSMAHWGSVFVEIGEEAFTPVKTVADLLRPEHQA